MYDKGIDIMFAAGVVGNDVMAEAKTCTEGGEGVLVIEVDVDQYDQALFLNGNSIISPSAIKCVNSTTYDMMGAFANGEFPGGNFNHGCKIK